VIAQVKDWSMHGTDRLGRVDHHRTIAIEYHHGWGDRALRIDRGGQSHRNTPLRACAHEFRQVMAGRLGHRNRG
jgi:hypothetical protein